MVLKDIPTLNGCRPLRPGERLDFFISWDGFLDENESEVIVSRTWTVTGPAEADGTESLNQIVVGGRTYLNNELIWLKIADDAEDGVVVVVCEIVTDRGREVQRAFKVDVKAWEPSAA